MNSTKQLIDNISKAIDNRKSFIEKCHQENTNCYRLFHGTVEGEPGLTVDKYGEQILIQSFHQELTQNDLDALSEFFTIDHLFYHPRVKGKKTGRQIIRGSFDAPDAKELGTKYHCDMSHQGQDPLLFLDFRAARRLIGDLAANKRVLNTFSFSCGIGIHALKHGAKHVTNVDFAASALDAGKYNARLNQLDEDAIQFIQSDFFWAIRQMAGLGKPGRKHQKSGTNYKKQAFDLVILDPPRWAKSKFGTVDLVNDYNSVLKPVALCVNPGGLLLCTNNVASVNFEQWIDTIEQCLRKIDRPTAEMIQVLPEEDFPSFDESPPLKQVLIRFR